MKQISKKITILDTEVEILVPDTISFPSEKELNEIIADRKKRYNVPIKKITLSFDEEFVDTECIFEPVPFERIRRITGYLVGDVERFNNAKRAEVADRLSHTLSTTDKMRMRDTDADGRNDYIDTDGYTKPMDNYYKQLSAADYERIQERNKSLVANCRRTADGDYILQCNQDVKQEIDNILKPVLRHTVKK